MELNHVADRDVLDRRPDEFALVDACASRAG
jgi:hypothetical protein